MIPPRSVPALLLLLLAAGCAAPDAEDELLVFAAASLADVAPELAEAYAAETGQRVRFSFGSSAALARQVASGAPADLIITADLSVIDWSDTELAEQGAWLQVATNELVVVRPVGIDRPWAGLSAATRIAVGDWRAQVPVGLRAQAWIAATGRWEELQAQLLPCSDARAALSAVGSGAADAGIVYATDAASSERVELVEHAGPSAPVTVYTACELRGARVGSWSFVEFLAAPDARAIWEKHGFGAGLRLAVKRGE